jgi:hypothetical protein
MGWHATVITLVIHEVNNELYFISGGITDNGVRALDAVGTDIDLGVFAFNKRLVQHTECELRYVVKAWTGLVG